MAQIHIRSQRPCGLLAVHGFVEVVALHHVAAQRLQQLDDSSQVTPADEQLVRALVGASNANTANSACQVCRHRISNPLAGHKIDAFNSVKKREKRYPTNACCV